MTSVEQKQELFKTIWNTAEELRNSVDGWDFKSYVLGFLFYRFISENITNYINDLQAEAGEEGFDYANFDDKEAEAAREQIVDEKGFFILPSQLFCNVKKNAASDDDLNITLQKVFDSIENSAIGTDSEDDMKGLFDDIDLNSNKLGNTVPLRNESLRKILNKIGGLELDGDFEKNKIDVFGDAYEFLMKMYASKAGRSGGEYFTPQEVSELLAKITVVGKKEVRKVYDPACGSGSLLLQFAKVLGKENVKVGFFGQEKNITTYNLCRINMFLHNINYNNFDIRCGNTLLEPYHWDDEPFEAIVSNPPYSTKWDGDANPILINDQRFAPAGVLAPKSKSDLAFTMHMLSWLATDGTAAIVEYPGVLHRMGAEQKIRKYLIDNNFVDTIIQLPADLFFGVTITTCIIVLKKSKKDNNVFFIDASNEYIHEGNKNKLSPENIKNILNSYVTRKDIKHISASVANDKIAGNNYNLSVSRYVKSENTKVQIDIEDLNERLEESISNQVELRTQIDALLSRIDNCDSGFESLVCQMCPNGVEYKSLGELLDYEQPTKYIVKSTKYNDEYKTPVLTAGLTFILGYTDETENIYKANKENPTIIFDDFTTSFHWVDFDFKMKSSAMKMLRPSSNDVMFKYIYYAMSCIKYEVVDHTRHWISKYSKLEIPVPPIEIQEYIVNFLDEYSSLTEKLQYELNEELQMRKAQHDFYGNRLLKL